MTTDLNQAFATFYEQLEAFEVEIIKQANLLDKDDMATLLFNLRDSTQKLRDVYSYLQTEMARNMDKGELYEKGKRSIEKKGGSGSVKWDNAALKSVVSEKILETAIDRETGAMNAPLSQIVAYAFECVGIDYWKVGELNKLGINPNLYRETSGYKENLIIR